MTEVNASIITIGDELLIGQTVDTNSAFIAQELNKIGIWVRRRVAIGDVKNDILSNLEEESKRSQVIIITGGLGPTADDITKPALCDYFETELVLDSGVEAHVASLFRKFDRVMSPRNRKQAEVPANCTVLHNERGTAPGMWFNRDGVVYIALPGVPVEMMGLIENEVIPKLKDSFELPCIIHKTALTFGQAESAMADHLADFESALPENIKLAYLPGYRVIKLRLTGKGSRREELETSLTQQFELLKERVQDWLVADEDLTMVEVIGRLLDERHQFLATAESCTGGYIAHLITSRSGSSHSFKGSVVSYANEAKENALGVAHQTLITNGAVSEETVREMVTGVVQLMNVDFAVATSGVMGPNGGTKEKPVGTVWIGIGSRDKVVTRKHFVQMDRKRNIEITASIALNMLWEFIIKEGDKKD